MIVNSRLLNSLDELITKQEMLNKKKISRAYYTELINKFTDDYCIHRKTVFSLIRRRKSGELKLGYRHNSLLAQAEEYLAQQKLNKLIVPLTKVAGG